MSLSLTFVSYSCLRDNSPWYFGREERDRKGGTTAGKRKGNSATGGHLFSRLRWEGRRRTRSPVSRGPSAAGQFPKTCHLHDRSWNGATRQSAATPTTMPRQPQGAAPVSSRFAQEFPKNSSIRAAVGELERLDHQTSQPREIPMTHDNHLSARIPGQAVMTELLRLHRLDRSRTFLGRFFGSSPLGPGSWPWYQGAVGELAVASCLARLGPEWTVFHSIPVGNGTSDIDHVVIGPGGVFTINTKNHAAQALWVTGKTFMVAGQRQRHIPNAAYEARRASLLLSRAVRDPIHARALVVVVNPRRLTIREKPAEVTVLTDGQLIPWLHMRPPVLGSDRVADIAAAANQPRTWRRAALPAEDNVAIRGEFESLRALVQRARRRRSVWQLAVLAGPLATTGLLASHIPGAVLQLLIHR